MSKRIFVSEQIREKTAEPLEAGMKVIAGGRYSLYGINVVITSPIGENVKIGSALATGDPVIRYLPFHLGFVEDTNDNCKVVIRGDANFEDDTPCIVLDLPIAKNYCEHLLIFGYYSLEEMPEQSLDILCIDPSSVKKYRCQLVDVRTWLKDDRDSLGKAFSGKVVPKEVAYSTTPAGDIPLSYSYINGHKVYKATILGPISGMSDTWRQLCDTLSFMTESDIAIIYISSGGGDTQTASSVIAAMSQSLGTIVTVACGPCASAAPVIWSRGDIRLVTDNASMMVHNIAICDPSTKTTKQMEELGKFIARVAREFLTKTVGKVGLATAEEIDDTIETGKEHYHSADEARRRTGATLIRNDSDIWAAIDGYNHEQR